MRQLTLLILLTLTLLSYDVPSSFKNYKKYSIDSNKDIIDIYLSPKLNESAKTIKNKYIDFVVGEDSKYALQIKIKNQIIKISLSQGQGGPAFGAFFRFGKLDNYIPIYSDEKIFISEHGFIYSINRMNDIYTTYKKYKLLKGKIREIKQPFYKILRECKTSALTKIYSQKHQKGHLIASIPKGEMVKVLLADISEARGRKTEEREYLVETSFGLVGWVTSKAGYNPLIGKPLSCLIFDGD